MNARAGIIGFVAGAASYLYIWLNPQTSNLVLYLAICALAGLVASLQSHTKMTLALIAVMMGAFTLNVAHIARDVAADPTSHNLFPFELAFTLLITGSGATVGIALGMLAKRWSFPG